MKTKPEKHYSLTEIRKILGVGSTFIYREWRKWIAKDVIDREKVIQVGKTVKVPESEVQKIIEYYKMKFINI